MVWCPGNDTKVWETGQKIPKSFPEDWRVLRQKVNALGLDFGIWVEPEMVNADSNLYRAHPDWCMEIPGMEHSQGRNQRLLDLCNPAVVDYLIGSDEQSFFQRQHFLM